VLWTKYNSISYLYAMWCNYFVTRRLFHSGPIQIHTARYMISIVLLAGTDRIYGEKGVHILIFYARSIFVLGRCILFLY